MSELKIKGEITAILEIQAGTSKAGKEWTKQDFIILSEEKFPKMICFTLFGDKTSLLNGLELNSIIDVHFNLESREFNGKYYHNLNAWKIDVVNNESTEYSPAPPQAEGANNQAMSDPADDLPFAPCL